MTVFSTVTERTICSGLSQLRPSQGMESFTTHSLTSAELARNRKTTRESSMAAHFQTTHALKKYR